jgi:hypothetical protein
MTPIASIVGAARDLVTGPGGVTVATHARLGVTLDEAGLIASVVQNPTEPSCEGIVGARVGFGFRTGVKDVLIALAGTPLGLLVDDISGAPAPSGYGSIRERLLLGLAEPSMPPATRGLNQQTDVCAGWRTGGVPTSRRLAGQPLPFEADPPVAPPLVEADGQAWHEMGRPGARQSRRVRRMDVWGEDDLLLVDAMFRDTTMDPDLTERVVHEYSLTASLDRSTLTIVAIRADPRTLPFASDCPAAAGSAALFVGHQAGDLRQEVGRTSRGAISCTHLNDLLRSLADVGPLAELLPEAG